MNRLQNFGRKFKKAKIQKANKKKKEIEDTNLPESANRARVPMRGASQNYIAINISCLQRI